MSNHKQVESDTIQKTDNLLELIQPKFRPIVIDYINSLRFSTQPRTRYEYLLNLKQFLSYLDDAAFGFNNISDLSSLKSKDFTNYLLYIEHYVVDGVERRNSVNSIRRKFTAVKRFMDYLYRTDIISTNEINKVEMPRSAKKKPIIYLTQDETASLLENVMNGTYLSEREKKFHDKLKNRDLAFFLLMLSTGIRVSECVELDIDDVDMKNTTILVTRKGGKQEILYFSDQCAKYMKIYIEERAKNKNLPKTEKALFISNRNKRICIREAQKLVAKYNTSLKSITPHKLRSTFATNLYQATGDIGSVAEALGHEDVNTTKKHYAHISEDIKRKNRNLVSYKTEGDDT
jgi:integrase/recombinase XerC